MVVEFKESELIRLTPRQQDVAKLVAIGFTNRDVAEDLGISEHAVKTHLRRTYDRLGVENRTMLSVRLISH